VSTGSGFYLQKRMESFQDILLQGSNVFRGVLDITMSMIPGCKEKAGGNGNGKKGNGNGKASAALLSPKKTNKACCSGNPVFNSLSTSGRSMIRLAGISGALAVGLGAYGAHVIMINEHIPEEQKHSLRTANMYHFIGTFGLVASALGRHPLLTGLLMATGTFVFCGTCYYHGMTGDPRIKKFAPFGGTTLILAWLSLVW